jgi:hypothetical protein
MSRGEPCACGCGQLTIGRSRYVAEHFAILVASRRRLRECRRYAYKRGHEFALDLEDVQRLVAKAWPRDADLALRRLDPKQGFTSANVALVPTVGGRRRRPTDYRLKRRLERLAARADLFGFTCTDELAMIFVSQEGYCALSGRRLVPEARLEDPDGIALLRIDPTEPPLAENIILVTTGVELAARWGIAELRALAHDLVTEEARQKKACAQEAGNGPAPTKSVTRARRTRG